MHVIFKAKNLNRFAKGTSVGREEYHGLSPEVLQYEEGREVRRNQEKILR